jgi:hypothetical protein
MDEEGDDLKQILDTVEAEPWGEGSREQEEVKLE